MINNNKGLMKNLNLKGLLKSLKECYERIVNDF